tara:strand:- start:45 stop:437 length:393 start_codon:yes stop_codon:yes gene_type:complete
MKLIRIFRRPKRLTSEASKEETPSPQTTPKRNPNKEIKVFTINDIAIAEVEMTALERAIDNALTFGTNMQYSIMAQRTIEVLNQQDDKTLAAICENNEEKIKLVREIRDQNIMAFALASALKQELEGVSA